MENFIMIAVWIITILMFVVPMSLSYKIIGSILSILLLIAYLALAQRNNRLQKTAFIMCLIVIGWDLAMVYMMMVPR